MKTCSSCKKGKPSSEFFKHRGTRDGLQPHCKKCSAEHLKKHRRENPELHRSYQKRHREKDPESFRAKARERYQQNREREARKYLGWRLERDFGISLAEYDDIVSRPCAICGAEENIVLDHCHRTNQIRGPLCQKCNMAIGRFDDPDRLRKVVVYLGMRIET